ncbi:MAG: hypothetical protein ACR2KO_11065 [Geodermatophilaceae bacterium]
MTLLRIGPVDDWVRTIAHHLRADPILLGTDRDDIDRTLDAHAGRPLVLSADIAGLSAILQRLVRRDQVTEVPVGWVADTDKASRELSSRLGLPPRPTLAADVATADEVRNVRLVRDDHGGLLLHRGRLSGWAGAAMFGAQTYHDDELVADGTVRRIDVRPDYGVDCGVVAEVAAGLLRRTTRSTGRSVQTSCGEALSTVDGVLHPRPVRKWTWYADPRQYWLLRVPSG